MRIFLDTNILLDIIEQRTLFFRSSQEVLDRCDRLRFETYLSWHALATIFYITAKKQNEALGYGMSDYEDALQGAAAEACMANLVVTRDTSGFGASPVECISPTEFLQRFPLS